MFKKWWIGGLAGIVLALVIAGTVLAQGPTPQGDDGVCPFDGECGGYGMGGWGYRGALPGSLADALGMTLAELYAALSDGKTIAEVATAQGVELSDLVAALITLRIENLNKAVADGDLTQEQADSMIDEMTEHLTQRLENWGLGYGNSGGGCGMGGGFRGGRWGNSATGGQFGGRWSGGMRGERFGGRRGNGTFAPQPPA